MLDKCTDNIDKILNKNYVSQFKYVRTERAIDNDENKKMSAYKLRLQ